MSRHVMECMGMSRVTIEDGKVTDVTEPRIRRCPLFAKYRGMGEITADVVRQNIEYRIDSFGMCTEDRVTRMGNFLSFGISETMSSALINGEIDAAVMAADGCGTVVLTDPEVVQGLGGRISGICETEPIPAVVEAVGEGNMLDPETARIDMVAGLDKAVSMGYRTVAVTTPSMSDARIMRERHGDRAVIIAVHTTGMSEDDARTAFDVCDIITACASKHLREEVARRPDVLIAGNKVPVYAVTEKGKRMVGAKLAELGREPWDPSQGEEPPEPLI